MYVYRFKKLKGKVWPSADISSDASSSIEDYSPEGLRKEPELKLRTYPYMLFPLAPAKVAWDYLIMFLVAYNAVELPFSIAFDYAPCQVRIQLLFPMLVSSSTLPTTRNSYLCGKQELGMPVREYFVR